MSKADLFENGLFDSRSWVMSNAWRSGCFLDKEQSLSVTSLDKTRCLFRINRFDSVRLGTINGHGRPLLRCILLC
jgi:hypothetical protein